MKNALKNAVDKGFYVKALWDSDAQVYYSQSNIAGLHIETDTLHDFEEVMMDVAPELIYANVIAPLKAQNIPQKDIPKEIPFTFKGAQARDAVLMAVA